MHVHACARTHTHIHAHTHVYQKEIRSLKHFSKRTGKEIQGSFPEGEVYIRWSCYNKILWGNDQKCEKGQHCEGGFTGGHRKMSHSPTWGHLLGCCIDSETISHHKWHRLFTEIGLVWKTSSIWQSRKCSTMEVVACSPDGYPVCPKMEEKARTLKRWKGHERQWLEPKEPHHKP